MNKKHLPKEFRITILSEAHSKLVQERLFELGYKWSSVGSRVISQWFPTDQIRCDKNKFMGTATKNYYDFYYPESKTISTEDLFTCIPSQVEVRLNDQYTAILSDDGIKVGCQTFPLSVIDELVKAKQELLNQ